MYFIKKTYGNGKNGVLFDRPILNEEYTQELCKKLDITLHVLDIKFLVNKLLKNKVGFITQDTLDKSIKNNELIKLYDEIFDYIQENNIKYFHIFSFGIHHEYIKKFREAGIEFSTRITDDPELSRAYSKPFVKYFDKAICSGGYYNSKITIEDKRRERGAKNVKFIPTFSDPKHYDYEPIDYSKKDIEVIFVGAVNWKKIGRISKLKKHFGDRMRLYGHYGNGDRRSIKGIYYKFINYIYKIGKVEKISDEELKDIYKRTQIGINIHLSYGPSNARSYEIPLNGGLLISDNPKGYQKYLYEVGEEILCYENNDIQDAIKKVEYYLKHYEERTKIAEAGHKKAINEYTYEIILEKTLTYIIE